MRKTIVAVLAFALLSACVPDSRPTDLAGPPSDAGPFAKFGLAATPEKVFIALRDSLENGTGDFLLLGLYKDRNGMQGFWQKIGGQGARVYFTIKAKTQGSEVKAAVVPVRPADPQGLAAGIDKVLAESAQALGVTKPALEPDR